MASIGGSLSSAGHALRSRGMRPSDAAAVLAAAGLAGLALGLLRRRREPALRHAVVTGGSRGLGLALAEALLDRGLRVTVCGREPETLARARRRLARRGRAEALRTDLAEPAEVDRFLREARRLHGPVDVLVNNAAVIQVGPLETTTWEDYERTLHTNFLAAVRLVLGVLPEMRESGRGHIVNVSSVGGRVGVPHMLPYVASKFALTGFSEGLRAELAGSGVWVTTVCPGLTRTGSPRHAEFRGRHRAEHAWFAVSDALPLLSGDARRTARRIVRAALRGRADVVTTLPARLATPLHGLFPGLTADVLRGVCRLLPPPPEEAPWHAWRGWESPSRWAPSLLTHLGDRAGRELNQHGHREAADPGPRAGR